MRRFIFLAAFLGMAVYAWVERELALDEEYDRLAMQDFYEGELERVQAELEAMHPPDYSPLRELTDQLRQINAERSPQQYGNVFDLDKGEGPLGAMLGLKRTSPCTCVEKVERTCPVHGAAALRAPGYRRP